MAFAKNKAQKSIAKILALLSSLYKRSLSKCGILVCHASCTPILQEGITCLCNDFSFDFHSIEA